LAVLLIVGAVAAGLWASGLLDPYLAGLFRHAPDATTPRHEASETPAKPVAPAAPVAEQAAPPPPAARQEPTAPDEAPSQPKAEHMPEAVPPSSETTDSAHMAALLQRLDTLDRTLRELMREQHTLRQALAHQQQMNLALRLRWIAAEDSTLPQMAQAWQEIALLPTLSDEQRQQAQSLQRLAQADANRLEQWRRTLLFWAEHLAIPTQPDIMPKPEHPWLAWLAGQFHLRRASTVDGMRQQTLAHELKRAALALQLERWPEQQAWQALRARLLLLAKAEGIALDLPEGFADLTADKHKLKAAAAAWLKGGN